MLKITGPKSGLNRCRLYTGQRLGHMPARFIIALRKISGVLGNWTGFFKRIEVSFVSYLHEN